jgi:hypothetical protein
MKKVAIILTFCFFCGIQSAKAEEVNPEQSINNEQAYFTANLQKQAQEGKQKQEIRNHFTFFTINVQINGKLRDIPENNAN